MNATRLRSVLASGRILDEDLSGHLQVGSARVHVALMGFPDGPSGANSYLPPSSPPVPVLPEPVGGEGLGEGGCGRVQTGARFANRFHRSRPTERRSARQFFVFLACLSTFTFPLPSVAQEGKSELSDAATVGPIRVLLVDGQNNHAIWPKTTDLMKSILEDTGRFSVEIARTKPKGIDEEFCPDFSKYQVVVSNYNGEEWPEATKSAFETFVAGGGGLVVVHAADNAFPAWPAWNRMIGLGGWGGRNESSGPWLYLDHAGQPVRDTAAGSGGSHGDQHEFMVVTRAPEHPVMAGLPAEWLHAQDELYDSLRGPAEEIEILATAWADPEKGGTGRHEPVVMAIGYEAGRVFHTTLGHGDYSVECAGFAALLQRGTEWAATGEVTQPPPDPANLPTTTATAVWKSSAATAQSAGDGR